MDAISGFESEAASKTEVTEVPKPEASIDPAFLLLINAVTGLLDNLADLMIVPPFNTSAVKPFDKSLVMEKLFIVLPYGFLSIHLHIAMQSSICHHPDLLTTFILMESMGNAIADFRSLDSRNGVQAPSAGDGLPALMRQTRKGRR